MDLPSALQAQSETFREMANIFKEMTTPPTGDSAMIETVENENLMGDPGTEILTAANKMIDEVGLLSSPETSASAEEISDDVREILNQTAPQADFGDNLHEVVAASFSKITNPVTAPLSEELKARSKVPANCKELAVAKVNPEIWSELPQFAKTKDAKAQHLQQHLSRALISQAKTIEKVLQLISTTKNAELQPILKSLMDSAMSVGQAMKEINVNRKTDLKASLLPEYVGLASANLPVTEYLFGDNLEASLKLLKSTSKIVKSTAPTGRYHPYGTRRFRAPSEASSSNLNFRRQSFRSPQMFGNQRPQWRPHQQFQRNFQTFQNQSRQ